MTPRIPRWVRWSGAFLSAGVLGLLIGARGASEWIVLALFAAFCAVVTRRWSE